MIAWSLPNFENVVAPSAGVLLLERAIAFTPGNPALHASLGNLYLDRGDFSRAAVAFETALCGDPSRAVVRLRLARCWNRLDRHQDVLQLVAETSQSDMAILHVQHGVALAALGDREAAERAFRLALDCDPRDRQACFELSRMLRRSGRGDELLTLCEGLAANGVDHGQLLLDWGRALAHNGQLEEARHLLFVPASVVRVAVPVPKGFHDLAEFNAALAHELSTNPYPLTEVPTDEVAMRGAARVEHLMNGARPDLIRTLLALIQASVDTRVSELTDSAGHEGDAWRRAVPARARIHAWGLIQKAGDYEEWHTHRGGWLSGVYYVQIPDDFSVEGEGAGCIEFGPPPSLAAVGLAPCGSLRVAPRAGLLLLTPSHFHHRTIPFQSDGCRISFAFDVRPM